MMVLGNLPPRILFQQYLIIDKIRCVILTIFRYNFQLLQQYQKTMNFQIKRQPKEQEELILQNVCFSPPLHQLRSVGKQPIKQKHRIKKRSKNHYNWTTTENRRYLKFLMTKKYVFKLSTVQKKVLKVNVMMSRKVETRTPTQCHSHHQKIMMKYGTIEHAIEALRSKFNVPERSEQSRLANLHLRCKPKKTVKQEKVRVIVKEEQNSTKSQLQVKQQVLVEEGQVDYKYYG